MMKAPAIFVPKEPLPDLTAKAVLSVPPRELYAESYQKGFQDGFAAADLSTPGVILCGSGLLALLLACIVVMRHDARRLFPRHPRGLHGRTPRNAKQRKPMAQTLPLVIIKRNYHESLRCDFEP